MTIHECKEHGAGPCLNENLIGEIAEANATLANRIAALEAENARLRAVVKQVEWTGYGQFAGKSSSYFHKFCDWCKRNEDEGHAPDCQRQAALGLAQTDTRRAAEGSNSTESTV